ncbi:2-(1,2-epoxy-1,2-dihydrophenyl)acetyl-CoA isomerase [Flexibacter flexilis DSM 6793]|uniref:2-(1,2-epoxy-1,2-dihydrophenyl)acetyl-CoA isomerase n=1 Tax=Flexibacter flexilis DSM 6793 TaxID=927664 RepID=A0A1I1G1U9_9BACT|nr:enoyl-CoA hydratase-related protein [Flexibacter flexilis]SFC05809.1 2-(1,2-epoxy-1,2-dihydrophenyl)acetyl-CoA isomerase [Flexibacter flexilis DSM 6793]
MFEHLLYQELNGVCTITINRPEVYNAINTKISYELQEALKKAAIDDNVRVIVLTGAGNKAFCSGQDLKESIEGKSFADSLHRRYNPIIRIMREMPKPIIARVNGVAAGAGCSLALACDLIVSAEEAVFSEIFVNIGLVLDSGSSFFLPRLVGYNKAFELSTLGTKITATEAHRLGIVNKMVPAAGLDEAVAEYTEYYRQAPTKAIGLMKKMLNRSIQPALEEILNYEALCQDIAGNTQDYKEGVTAFREKRKAVFTGK